jgi:hypothetical protein
MATKLGVVLVFRSLAAGAFEKTDDREGFI